MDNTKKVSLKDWVDTQKEKNTRGYLLYGSVKNGETALRMLKRDAICGIKPARITDLAMEIVYRKYRTSQDMQMINIIDSATAANLLRQVLDEGNYSFIDKKSICKASLADILTQTGQMRKGQKNPFGYDTEKKKELATLVEEYEKKLVATDSFDDIRLMSESLELPDDDTAPGMDIAVADFVYDRLSYLEKSFLEKASADATLTIIETPAKEHSEVTFFHGYGVINEVRHVADVIEEQKLPYGEVAVFYSHPAYVPHLMAELEKRGISYSECGGHPVNCYDRIRIFLKLLDFAESDFLYENLRPVVMDPAFGYASELEGNGNPAWLFVNGIRYGIGWGRRRYFDALEKRKAKAGDKPSDHDVAVIELLSFMCDIVSVFPEEGEKIAPHVLVSRLEKLVTRCTVKMKTKKNGGITRSIFDNVKSRLSDEGEMELEAAIKLIREEIDAMNIQDRPEPGSVMLLRMQSVSVCDRKNVFVIGMSDMYFSQNTVQSPTLRDDELLSMVDDGVGYVSLAGAKGEEYNSDVRKTIEMLPEKTKLCFGASIYDSFGLKEDYPSPLYNLLKKELSPDTDVPIYEYREKDAKAMSFDAKAPKASKATGGDPIPDHIIERLKKEESGYTMSPSAFQMLMECPRKYLYKYLLGIPDEQYQKRSMSEWLNVLETGIFLHRVLELYVDDVFVGQQSIAKDLDEKKLEGYISEAQQEILAETPAMQQTVVNLETENIRQMAKAYLEKMHEEFSDPSCKWKVADCEVRVEDIVPSNEIDMPVSVFDPDKSKKTGSMKITGRIDRLDEYTDDDGVKHYRIIDYKSGSPAGTQKKIIDGRELQHALYAAALAQKDDQGNDIAVVDEMVYVFPRVLLRDPNGDFQISATGDGLLLKEDFKTLFGESYGKGIFHSHLLYPGAGGKNTWYSDTVKGYDFSIVSEADYKATKISADVDKHMTDDVCKNCIYGTGHLCMECGGGK